MDKKENLTELKALFNIPEVKKGFKSQDECLSWIAKVAPLLKFNDQYYKVFYEESIYLSDSRLSAGLLGSKLKRMINQVEMAIEELKIEVSKEQNHEEKQTNLEGIKMINYTYDENACWEMIKDDFKKSKKEFGKQINFIKDKFKRKILFRDIGQAYILAQDGFDKPALILAGSVIEELLRLYLVSNNIKLKDNTFKSYIEKCEEHGLLKSVIRQQTEVSRIFRNIVHLENEKEKKHSISPATAKGSVAAIFTIVNDF